MIITMQIDRSMSSEKPDNFNINFRYVVTELDEISFNFAVSKNDLDRIRTNIDYILDDNKVNVVSISLSKVYEKSPPEREL